MPHICTLTHYGLYLRPREKKKATARAAFPCNSIVGQGNLCYVQLTENGRLRNDQWLGNVPAALEERTSRHGIINTVYGGEHSIAHPVAREVSIPQDEVR